MWMRVWREDDGHTRVGLEHGPHLWPCDVNPDQHFCTPVDGMSSHDPKLDVSAPTYEEAIVALAGKVRHHYGHDRFKIGIW
jgi:hypothetical protein